MTDRVKPPFILAFAADQQGCGFHRVMMPLGSLLDAGVANGRVDIAVWPDHVAAACRPDVVVWQRQVEDGALEMMRRWRKLLPDTLFVYELDDYLEEIPRASFHQSFMPPRVPEKVAEGLAICDRATTTTPMMAEWLRTLGCADVRVVPNALPATRVKDRKVRLNGRLRIGFVGGMSHDGDLELLRHAMETIGEEVEWVFFGTKPKNPPCRIDFREGVPVNHYLDVMPTLDLDLMLAPLEDNAFNRHKSNLRLVEAGAINACAIAQNLEPYLYDDPPVFAHAGTSEGWTAAIRAFMSATPAERGRAADKLRAWVSRNYVMERLVQKRLEAWTPEGVRWRPEARMPRATADVVVFCAEDSDDLLKRVPALRGQRVEKGNLVEACLRGIADGQDVLWLRPATSLGPRALDRMRASLRQATNVASVVPLGSDGPNAFPSPLEWMPMSGNSVASMEHVLSAEVPGKRLVVPAASGPCVLISVSALSMLGVPDVDGCGGNEEQAIMEWSLIAAMRQWRNMQTGDAFASSLVPPGHPTETNALRLQARALAQGLQTPPEAFSQQERERIELRLLSHEWGTPRPGSMGFGTSYSDWKALKEARDKGMGNVRPGWPIKIPADVPSIRVARFGESHLYLEDGWIVHVDDTVKLHDGALEAFAIAIAGVQNNVKVVYADHESLFPNGSVSPELKPDLDVEFLLADDYATPVCAVRMDSSVGSRAELYGWVLAAALADRDDVVHLPHVLGTMTVPTRPEELAVEAFQRQMTVETLLGESAVVEAHRAIPGSLSVRWNRIIAGVEYAPLVSIVVPTLGGGRLLQPCINTVRQHTDYPNWEIVVVHNGGGPLELGAAESDPRVRVVRWDMVPFNWAAVNNWAIREHARGEYIVTLNDDVTCGSPAWLDVMLGHLVSKRNIGAVGARLVHPAGFVQHIGVVVHHGVPCHMHLGLPNGHGGQMGRALLNHEVSAVTGACMMFSRAAFEAVGGFDESLPLNYNDTDFCMRLRRAGYINVVEMKAELLHSAGASRSGMTGDAAEGLRTFARENKVMAERWPNPDPYWHPDLTLVFANGGLAIQGLGADMLSAWVDEPRDGQERVLLLNDAPGTIGMSLEVIASGRIVLAADVSGFAVRLTAPNARNAAPWDVRDPSRMREGLRLLGVGRVVLRSLVGSVGAAAPIETLRCLVELGIPVEVRRRDGGVVRPAAGRDDPDDSAFGSVDRNAWLDAYERIAGGSEKVINMEAAQ